jgi:alkylation response protein AidB-like acyl-CoA dehydrogenase
MGADLSLWRIQTKFFDIALDDERKPEFIDPVIMGEYPSAIAMTEPNKGSDIASLNTKIVRKGNEYIINGSKTLITNAERSGGIIVIGSDGNGRERSMTAVVVDPRNEPEKRGLIIEPVGDKCFMPLTPTNQLTFDNYVVPESMRIGDEGNAYNYFLGFVNRSRPEIAAQALGMAKYAYNAAIEYTKNRDFHDNFLIDQDLAAAKLAKYRARINDMEDSLYNLGLMIDNNEKITKDMIMRVLEVKRSITLNSRDIVQGCKDLFGGYGLYEEFGMARAYRDVDVTVTYEGAADALLYQLMKNIRKNNNCF